MSHPTSIRIAAMILAVTVLSAAGCAGPIPYQRAWNDSGGYTNKPGNAPGTFEIDYVAQGHNMAFAKYAAYYRAAELTFESGYHYFIVLNAYDISQKGKAWGDPKDNLAGAVPGVRIIIQCFKQKPSQPAYDAYQYLSISKMPGTEDIISVGQRKADQSGELLNP